VLLSGQAPPPPAGSLPFSQHSRKPTSDSNNSGIGSGGFGPASQYANASSSAGPLAPSALFIDALQAVRMLITQPDGRAAFLLLFYDHITSHCDCVGYGTGGSCHDRTVPNRSAS
jgi:hypothetical protein